MNADELFKRYDNHLAGKAYEKTKEETINMMGKFIGEKCIDATFFKNPLTNDKSECLGKMIIDEKTANFIHCNRYRF